MVGKAKNISTDQLFEEVKKARASGVNRTTLFYDLQGRGLGTSHPRLRGAWERAEDEERQAQERGLQLEFEAEAYQDWRSQQ